MMVLLAWSCNVAALGLESWIGLGPKAVTFSTLAPIACAKAFLVQRYLGVDPDFTSLTSA